MALIIKDRVKEITTTTGTGAVSLGGASATFDAFQSVMSNGDTTFYAIVHTASGTDEWEVGLGTWNTGNTLTRTTVYAGSNGTSAVNFSSGNKDIFMTYPASKAVVAGEDVTFADITATDITSTGTVTLSADPSSSLQAATKQYVDTIAAAGIHYHTPVRVEHPSNLNATYNNGSSGVGATLTNAGTNAALVLDNVSMVLNDRVLVANQTDQTQNGVYTVTTVGDGSTAWVLTRSTDTDTAGPSDPDAFGKGDAFFIKEGDTNAGHLDVLTTTGTIVFGTTNIVFSEVAETSIYSAGTGLTLTGTTFSTNQDISTSASPTFNNITVTGTVDGRDVATDGSKLDGIEAGATADQTASEILTAIKTVDGSGSGLDADTLDGLQASSFLRSDATDTASGTVSFTGEPRFGASYSDPDSGVQRDAKFGDNGIAVLGGIKTDTITITNDGAGSGIDADLLDGQQGSYYLNTGTTFSGDVSGTYNNIVVANDSHTHDGRYYTETEADSRFVNVTGDTMSNTLVVNTIDSGNPSASTDNIRVSGYGILGNRGTFYVTNNGPVQIGVGSTHNNDPAMTFTSTTNTSHHTLYEGSNRVFTDGYHPNADKWTTARTLSLSGDASGSVSWDGSANATLSVTVANDSHSHSNYITSNADDSMSGRLTLTSSNNDFMEYNGSAANPYFRFKTSGTNNGNIQFTSAGIGYFWNDRAGQGIKVQSGVSGASWYSGGTYYPFWHSGNDGSGSGLDADLLDGVQASSFLRSDVEDSGVGINLNGGTLNQGNDATLYVTASNNNDWGIKIGATSGKTEYGMRIEMPASYNYAMLVEGNGTEHLRISSDYLYHYSDMRSPIFYDSNDTAYYVNPASTSNLSNLTVSANSAQLLFDRPDGTGQDFKFYQWSDGLNVFASTAASTIYLGRDGYSTVLAAHNGDIRSPIFYDYNNTGYYFHGDSLSNLYQLQVNYNNSTYMAIGASDDVRNGLRMYDTSSVATNIGGQLVLGYKYSGSTYTEGAIIKMYKEDAYNGNYGSGLKFQVRNHGEALGTRVWIDPTGNLYSDQSVRAPIFYDTDNTGYFLNPSSTSRLNAVEADGFHSKDMGDYYTFYGDNSANHSISSRNALGSVADDLRINSYGAVYINLDSNNNNTSDADFKIGRHGSNGTIADIGLFYVLGDSLYVGTDYSFRAPIFYDSNNTGYYVDPASTSNMSRVQAADWYYAGGNSGLYFSSWGGGFHMTDSTWVRVYNGKSFYQASGTLRCDGDIRAPIFYDQNNTSYYSNQASTSVFNQINVTTLNTTSDIRFKSDLVKIDNAVDKVKAINGYTYMLDGNDDRKGGLIAQEVEEVLPEAVKGDDYKKLLDYNATIALLVEAIKEQQDQIDALKKQLNG